MEDVAYKSDRSTWGPGPWDNEPEDRVDFIHAGFSCFVKRGPLGSWCGYVGVPESHPAYGKAYDEVEVDVHGGLTYANPCQGKICHVPQPGMPDKVWWLGFDTGHWCDIVPAHQGTLRELLTRESVELGQSYRTLAYTREQTEQLADQLAAQHGE